MTIKEQAYRAHAFLHEHGITSLKRSHIHELLAATVGYSTYAAFQHDATWCEVPFNLINMEPDIGSLQARSTELGLSVDEGSQITEALPSFLQSAGYAPVRFEALITALDGCEADPDWIDWVWTYLVQPARTGLKFYFEHYPVLLEGLEAAAKRGVSSAHLAIAKLLESEADLYGDDGERLKRQVMREAVWTTPFVGFADIGADWHSLEGKYRHHLFEAAHGGDVEALMEAAERYGNPAILDLAPSEAWDPMSIAYFAAEHRNKDKQRYWLTIAAEQGDIDAMRKLIWEHDEPLAQAWVWMHLSQMLDHDLSQDRYTAINEDGSPYDDDVGGPLFVGGHEGVELDELPADADRIAYQTAAELFARISAQRDLV